MQNGNLILNICKPAGMPSFKVVSIVRKRLGVKRVGFVGTLDPLACGVLVILVGAATKRANEFLGGTKVYRSVFTFGIETATLDSEGEIIARSDKILTEEEIKAVIKDLTGQIEITVPKFSAVHVNGQRAYDLARRGVEFTPPIKTVTVKRFELLTQIAQNKFLFEIECGTGTYIRSLAKLTAQKLGTVAIASLIIRTKVGNFEIKDSISVDSIRSDGGFL